SRCRLKAATINCTGTCSRGSAMVTLPQCGVGGLYGGRVVIVIEARQALAEAAAGKLEIIAPGRLVAFELLGLAVAGLQQMIQPAERAARRIQLAAGVRQTFLDQLALQHFLDDERLFADVLAG